MPSGGVRVSVRLSDPIGAQHKPAERDGEPAYSGCPAPYCAGANDDPDRSSSLCKKYRQRTRVCSKKTLTRIDYTFGRTARQIESIQNHKTARDLSLAVLGYLFVNPIWTFSDQDRRVAPIC